MARIVVVGGGTAGTEAAAEASRNDAEVLVLERSDCWEPSWRLWPGLILSPEEFEDLPSLSDEIELAYGKDVSRVGPNFVVISDGTIVRFDSVVLTTGSEFRPMVFPGRGKPGVVTLDRSEAYAQLGREMSSTAHAIVQGEGIPAIRVADALSGTGRNVTLLASPWIERFASATIGAAVSEAAAETGVSIINAKLESVIGCGHVEAVVAGGTVFPCDTLALLPRRVPRFPRMTADMGPNGGILVDRNLRSSSPVLFAAGGCAELRQPWPLTGISEGASGMSGRVAGANATGHALSIRLSKFASSSFFGRSWAKVGVGLGEAQAHGLEVSEISRRWSHGSACSIVYERPTGRIVGVEVITEAGDERFGVLAALVPSTNLRALAYGTSSDSSDISLVSDTARLGLQAWSGS
jgi:pyruvate/2-oxoglutarate dehydrogenase complex dihydrolipoamide dehydrogenase (E3) component